MRKRRSNDFADQLNSSGALSIEVQLTLLATLVLLIVSCGADGSDAGENRVENSFVQNEISISSPIEQESGFIRRKEPTEPGETYMDALLRSTLVVDKKGCLRFKESGDLPVWPREYSLVARGDGIVILDGKGRVEARVGDMVEAGGGQVTKQESNSGYEQKRKELQVPRRCRGSLWYVSPGLRVIRLG